MSNGYAAVVANGIALFKEQGITDWAKLVDFDQLDMWGGKLCIAGQVFRFRAAEKFALHLAARQCKCCDYNGYDFACELIKGEDSANFGFCPDGRFGSYDDLVTAWKTAAGL